MNAQWAEIVRDVLLFAGVVVAGAIWLLSRVRKDNQKEWQQLAEVRGQHAADLEGEVQKLEERVGVLEGQISVLMQMKGEQIAGHVIEALHADAIAEQVVEGVKELWV